MAEELDDPVLARRHFLEGLEGSERLGNDAKTALFQRSLAKLDLDAENPKRALERFRRSLELARVTANNEAIASSAIGVARSQLALGHNEEALQAALDADHVRRLLQMPVVDYDISETLSQAYAAVGRYEDAFRHQVSFAEALIEMERQKRSSATTQLTMEHRFETERREQAAVQELERTEAVNLVARQRFARNVSLVVAGLSTLFMLALGLGLRQKIKINRGISTLNANLQEALDEVKKLSGLLPICAHCKAIRDDQGYWLRVEDYISDHAGVVFSHGICPNCMVENYPGVTN